VAGGRTYSAGKVARGGYLFRCVRQSAIAFSVPVTRSLPSAWNSHGQKLTNWLYTVDFALRWIFSEIRVRKHRVGRDVYLESWSHLTVVVKISQRILDEYESKGRERERELENQERIREPTEVKLLLQMREMVSEGFDANWGRFLWTVTVVALPKTPRVILFVIVVKRSDLLPPYY